VALESLRILGYRARVALLSAGNDSGSSLCVRAGTDGDNVVGGRPCTDVLDAVLCIRVNEAYPSGAETMASAIDREFDGPFANKPHLRVNVMMRRMGISIRGQSRLMRFDMLAGCQSALMIFRTSAWSALCTGMFSNAKVADDNESSWAATPGIPVAVATSAEMREQASRLVKAIRASPNICQMFLRS
jgi:hypothetical protein